MDDIPSIYRNRRIALGLTQEQASKLADVSRRTLIDFETGGERITTGNLRRVLNAVGLDLATRELAARPTLDELSARYGESESPPPRRRARPRKDVA